MDKVGRVALSKQIRQKAPFRPGERLEVFLEGLRLIIQPIQGNHGLINKDGVLVFESEGIFDPVELVAEEREDHLSKMTQSSSAASPKAQKPRRRK